MGLLDVKVEVQKIIGVLDLRFQVDSNIQGLRMILETLWGKSQAKAGTRRLSFSLDSARTMKLFVQLHSVLKLDMQHHHSIS
ncbi:hypothetical protein ACFX1Q_001104 [Malus domestica]